MRIILAAGLCLIASPVLAADFAWMTGCWEEKTGTRWTEECWTVPRGGMLMGSGRTGEGADVKSYEFMRIAPDADGVPVFWGSSGGKTPVPFRLVREGAGEAVFENPAHDYPVRVRYWREGETLNAETLGADGKNAMTWRYARM